MVCILTVHSKSVTYRRGANHQSRNCMGEKLIDHDMPSLNTRLYSFHTVGETGSTFFTKKAYECNAHICLSLRNGLSPREISKAAIKISNLWSIISGAWCQIRHIALHQEYES